VELLLRNAATSPLRVEDARPQAQTLTSALAQWRFDLGVDETRSFVVGLRLPATAGNYTLESSLLLATNPSAPPLANNTLAIPVAAPRDLSTLLSQDLDALALSHPSELNARTRAKAYVGDALAALQAHNRDAAIDHLFKALDELGKIESADTTDCHVYLSAMIKSARVAALP
jgi:hypothetical protein